MSKKLPEWLSGLTYKDFLKDGSPMKQTDWDNLDWREAYVDIGPSPAGNFGPYWHVPHKDKDEGTVHRLYPKVLKTKWAPLIRQAMLEYGGKNVSA